MGVSVCKITPIFEDNPDRCSGNDTVMYFVSSQKT